MTDPKNDKFHAISMDKLNPTSREQNDSTLHTSFHYCIAEKIKIRCENHTKHIHYTNKM